jgi:hypothetical protein
MSGRGQGQGNNQGLAYINGFPVLRSLYQASGFAVNQNSYETLTQSLYDSAIYPAAGSNQITFFQTAIGAGVGVISGVAKTPEDTNMQVGGTLPAMQAYIVSSIEVEVTPAVSNGNPIWVVNELPAVFGAQAIAQNINDIYKIRQTGYLLFNIGSKAYMTEGPLMKFPASNDFMLNAAVADIAPNGAGTGNMQSRIAYGNAGGPPYLLSPNNLLLVANQNFSITLNWATLEPVTAAGRIFVRLMGQLLRASQ